MKLINKVKIGTDPEFFIQDRITKEVVSGEGLIGGTKDNPKKISEVGHAIQEDNIMAEFNIPPAIDENSFSKDIQFVIDYIADMLPYNLEPYIVPSAFLDEKYLQTEQAFMFGCDPDFNVWTRSQNESPNSATTLRTCGGHIHIGYENPSMENSEIIIKAMDLFLGVPSILLDVDTERRKMYGNAGSFRFKDYGVEYRTLSNFWVATDDLRKWAFRNTLEAIDFINEGNKIEEEWGELIVECINNQNKDLAYKIINHFNIPIIELEKTKVHEKISKD